MKEEVELIDEGGVIIPIPKQEKTSGNFKHACVKPGCSNTYEDEDPDRYYCPPCKEENKRIAAEVDRKIGSQPRERVMSDLEIFDAQATNLNQPNGRTISFVKTTL